jgi:hypothetical protein
MLLQIYVLGAAGAVAWLCASYISDRSWVSAGKWWGDALIVALWPVAMPLILAIMIETAYTWRQIVKKTKAGLRMEYPQPQVREVRLDLPPFHLPPEMLARVSRLFHGLSKQCCSKV